MYNDHYALNVNVIIVGDEKWKKKVKMGWHLVQRTILMSGWINVATQFMQNFYSKHNKHGFHFLELAFYCKHGGAELKFKIVVFGH